MLRRTVASLVSVVSLLGLLAVGRAPDLIAQEGSPMASPAATPFSLAEVVLRDVSGAEVGIATFAEAPDGSVSVGVGVQGLTPGEHGIHVHETGICDPTGDQPFASAGGHFNPTGETHGSPSGDVPAMINATPVGSPVPRGSHAGDLGNIVIDDAGMGRLQIETDRFTLAPGPTSLADADGSALVIHADRDDMITDPTGNSGGRIVCGVVAAPQNGAPMTGSPEAATPAS